MAIAPKPLRRRQEAPPKNVRKRNPIVKVPLPLKQYKEAPPKNTRRRRDIVR